MNYLQIFKDRYTALGERDQRALRLGGLSIVATLLIAAVFTVITESRNTVARVNEKRQVLADTPALQDRVQRLQRLGPYNALPLEALARRIAQSQSIELIIETGQGPAVRVRGSGIPFDAAMAMLGDFEATSIAVTRATVVAAGSGRVDFELDLQPPAP
ncbi:MAG: type II secretion system protein M [Gammaproteobacteria bacterium]|nr:type II secretion system protein M [Gammaproteobacteria bacterium]